MRRSKLTYQVPGLLLFYKQCRMKKLILSILPFFVLLLSCAPDFDEALNYPGNYPNNPIPPGTPATFTIHENGSTYVLEGDAYFMGYGFYDGPGSVIHRELASYKPNEPKEYYYKLECIGPFENGDYAMRINFDLHTTAHGQPIDLITTGTYYANNSNYLNDKVRYQAFHNNDSDLNQKLSSVVYVNKIIGGRMDGSFTGKYIKINPDTGESVGEIIPITGEFTNVYIHDVW